MECFSYKGGCGIMHIKAFEEVLALATIMYLLMTYKIYINNISITDVIMNNIHVQLRSFDHRK